MQPSELLAQLQSTLATVAADQADAQRWRDFSAGLAKRGWGGQLSIADILAFVPDMAAMKKLAAESWPAQEVAESAAPAGRKKRWKLVDADKSDIAMLRAAGWEPEKISERLGLAVSVIERMSMNRLVNRVDEVDNDFLDAVVRAGLRSGTPVGLASAVRAAALVEDAVVSPAATGSLAAVCVHPEDIAAGDVGRDEPDAVFDWIYSGQRIQADKRIAAGVCAQTGVSDGIDSVGAD